MKTSLYIVCSLMMLLVNPANAATVTPEKVGTYVGTLVQKNYDYQLGTVTIEKHTLTLTIGANDSFDMWREDGPIGNGTGVFGYNNGYLFVNIAQLQYVVSTTLHFKNGVAKGQMHVAVLTSPGFFSEGKFSVKKQ